MSERKSAGRKPAEQPAAPPVKPATPGLLPFIKMHGLGNDYVYLDLFDEAGAGSAASAAMGDPAKLAALARAISDRHFGVGGDGLILVQPSESADVKMRMFNADGSEGAMCGNGIRCVAKLAYEAGHVTGRRITVETKAGIKTLELITSGGQGEGRVEAVRVNMGAPKLNPADVPVKMPGERVVSVPIILSGRRFDMTCLSMGNPHAVIFCDNVDSLDLNVYGPAIERHPMFPDRVNAHFVRVHSRGEVTMRTWERGSGITLACGTGASAVCVAGVLNNRTDRQIVAHLPGGDLELNWDQGSGEVFMTGPATEVFRGEWKVQDAK